MSHKSARRAIASLPVEDRDEILKDYVYFEGIELALRNCLALANANRFIGDWKHIKTFAEQGGLSSSLLRKIPTPPEAK